MGVDPGDKAGPEEGTPLMEMAPCLDRWMEQCSKLHRNVLEQL